MNLEKRLDELGSVIQKGEEIFELSQEKFLKEFAILPNEITIGMLLFRKVIEKLDAIFILIENGSEMSAESITRDLFENLLYLKFLLKKDYFERRALSYQYAVLEDKLDFCNLVSSNHKKGQGIRDYINKELPLRQIQKQKEIVKNAMNKECYKNIKIEWERIKKKGGYPKWYSLFKGPRTIKELAIDCKFEPVYHILYRIYSKQVHSGNALEQIGKMENSLIGIKDLRGNENSDTILLNARSFGLHAIREYVNFFSLESTKEQAEWYKANIEKMKR